MAAIATRLENISIELFRGPVLPLAPVIPSAHLACVCNALIIAKLAKSIVFIAPICSVKCARQALLWSMENVIDHAILQKDYHL